MFFVIVILIEHVSLPQRKQIEIFVFVTFSSVCGYPFSTFPSTLGGVHVRFQIKIIFVTMILVLKSSLSFWFSLHKFGVVLQQLFQVTLHIFHSNRR